MSKGEEKIFHCPLCGNLFLEETSRCSGGCLLGQNCGLICCPRCHYQWAKESKMVKFLNKIFGKGKTREELL